MGKFKNSQRVEKAARRGRSAKSVTIDVSKFNEDIKALADELKLWTKNLQLDGKKILKPAGEVVRQEIAKRTPVYPRRHYRYPSGGGNRIATYYPGNLRRSIQDLDLQRTSGVFIGPRVVGDSKGTFSGTKVDGWYAQIVDRGAPAAGRRPKFGSFDDTKERRYEKKGGIKASRFVRRGATAAKPRALAIINRRLIERLKVLRNR